jgi:molecular chaperone Hsp33
MAPVTEVLRSRKSPEDFLGILFAGIPFDTLEKRKRAFRCFCSRKRVKRALLFLGRDDLVVIIAERDRVEVTCEFCRKAYHFSREVVERFLRETR